MMFYKILVQLLLESPCRQEAFLAFKFGCELLPGNVECR